MNEYVVSIDIGSSKIKAAIGTLDENGKLQIIGITSVKCSSIDGGNLEDIENIASAIKSCIFKLESISGMKIESVSIGVDAGFLNVGHAGEEKASSIELDANLTALNNSFIQNLTRCVELTEVKVDSFILHGFHRASSYEDTNEYTAFVDVGAKCINISIGKGKVINYSSLIPFGGDKITDDISKCLKVSSQEAEKLKKQFGDIKILEEEKKETIEIYLENGNTHVIDKSLLIEIISARVEELLFFIKDELKNTDYYDKIAVIVVCGGGISMFNHSKTVINEILEKQIIIPEPEFLEYEEPIYYNVIGTANDALNSKVKDFDVNQENETSNLKNNKNNFISKIRELIEEFF